MYDSESERFARISRLLAERVQALLDGAGVTTTELGDRVASFLGVKQSTSRVYMADLVVGFNARFLPAGDNRDVERLERLAVILHTANARPTDPIVRELKREYASLFVYPPKSANGE